MEQEATNSGWMALARAERAGRVEILDGFRVGQELVFRELRWKIVEINKFDSVALIEMIDYGGPRERVSLEQLKSE